MGLTPSRSVGPDNHRSTLRRLVVVVGGLLALVTGALVATAATGTTPAPTGQSLAVVPSAGYTSLTITLSEPLYSSQTKGALTTSSFAAETNGVSVAPTAMTGTGPYVLTFAAATTPNVSKVVLASSFTADSTAVGRMETVVPLIGSAAVRTVAGLGDVQVDGKPFAPMPFVGSWMASLAPKATSGGGAALRQAAGATLVGPSTSDRQSSELEVESTPIPLTTMVTGLQAALDRTVTMTTQAEVATALEAVPGIASVSFTSTGARITFDVAENAGTQSSEQRTEVTDLHYAIDGTTSFELHLGGHLDLALPDTGTGAAQLAAMDLSLRPRSLVLPAAHTIGMVAVTSDAAITTDVALGVSCAATTCSATPTVSATGGVTLAVQEVRFADGGGVTKVDVKAGGQPVSVAWTPADWNLTALAALTEDESATAKALTDALLPTVTNDATWAAKGLIQLDQLDSHAVTLGLEWVGNWLRSTDAVEALGTQLPAVGLSVGDVLQLSDQVGARVTSLVNDLEPDGTSPQSAPEPTAQDVLRALCAQDMVACDGGLKGLDIDVDGLDGVQDKITYDVEVDVCQLLFGDAAPAPAETVRPRGACATPAGVPVEQAGPAIDLAGADDVNGDLNDLVGIQTTLRTGTWKGTASATLAFRLTLDLRPDAVVKHALGDITEDDYPGPGFDKTSRLAPGDLCRGLALELGSTQTLFAEANGQLENGTPKVACDTVAWSAAGALRTVQVPQGPEGDTKVAHPVTALEVCSAAALKNGLQVEDFLVLNGFDAAGCAARAYLQVTSTTAPTPTADGEGLVYPVDTADGLPFVYYAAPAGLPLPVPFRLAVSPLGNTPFVAADVDVRGTDLTGEVSLGFLDLGLTGSVMAAPTVEVDLASSTPSTLVDLAEAADSDTPSATIGALLDTSLGGDLQVDFGLTNTLAFPDGAAFELRGDPADLLEGSGATLEVEADCGQLADDETGICSELGDWPNVTAMTPAQVQRTVTELLDRITGLTSAGDAAVELPIVGVSMQDLVGLNSKLHDLAGVVETREPKSLSALQEALEAGLTAAGLPTDGLAAAVDGEVFTLTLPLDVTGEEASYPFGFDVGFDDDDPDAGTLKVRVSPADGGARITAAGAAVFTPTFGLDLSSGVEDDLDDHIFLDTSGNGAELAMTGDVPDKTKLAGDVTFGSLTSDMRATAAADPALTLHLSELADANGRLSLSSLDTYFDAEAPADLPDAMVDWSGDMSLEASIKGVVKPFSIDWAASLQDIVAGDAGDEDDFTKLPNLDDFGVKLDLATLVGGTSQTARFVGRALAESDALSTSLPLVGDQLAALSSVGKDLQGFATTVDDLYAEVEANDQDFVEDINKNLKKEVCDPITAGIGGECNAGLGLFQDGETQDKPDVTLATGVELQLTIDREESLELPTPKLLDVPGFEVDTASALELRAGYRLGLTLGLDLQRGFYVKGRDVGTEDEPDLSRLIEVYGRAGIGQATPDTTATADGADPAADNQEIAPGGAVKIGGVTAFTLNDLDMSLGGSLGPDEDAAGFALDMPEPLTLMDVVNGRRSVDEIFEPKISVIVDAKLTIGTPSDATGAIPTLAFPVFFNWTQEGVIGGGMELASPSLSIGKESEDSYVTIDVTSLVDHVVKPALVELNKYNPVAQAAPIKDALNSQVPVLDQSVRGLLDGALGGDPRWQLLSFLLDLDDVATSLKATPTTGLPTLIPLGGYVVLPDEEAGEEKGYFTPPGDGEVWDDPALGFIKDLVTKLSAAAGGSKKFVKPTATTPKAPGTWDGNLNSSSTTQVSSTPLKRAALKPVVSMPILDSPLSAATLLFGGEVEPVSFIEIAPPAVDFGMSVKFERTLFDLNLGAIEARLSVGLEGAVGVTLRVGVGYSSHGLTSGNALNGLYLVDAYDGNRALPMVALGGRVSVRVDGRFSVVGIAEATFSGSGYVRLEGGLDLFDESLVIPEAGRGDGMFHVDEMLRVVDGHQIGATKNTAADLFCIFRPTVQLQAGLAFSASAKLLGIEVWSGSFAEDYDLVDEEWSCPYVKRVAQLVERDVVLAAGPTAQERLDDKGDIAETFTITQDAEKITVTGGGELGTGYPAMSFPLDGIDQISADLGDGNDTVHVAAGVTVPLHLFGGPGNDVLEGGDGDDVLAGGDGVDTISTRGGDDEVVIGADGVGSDRDLTAGNGLTCAGCNVVLLGEGDDTVTGGPAPVAYRTTAAGFGHARIAHEGETMVLDLGAFTGGVHGVVDALGLHVTTADGGTLDTSDPSTLARFGGSGGDDRLRVADGPRDMYVDGGAGADVITVETNGNDRTARVHDSGPAADADELLVRGTSADERFLLRAHVTGNPPDTAPTTPANEGVVAVLSPESQTLSKQVDSSPVSAGVGADSVTYEYEGSADATQLVFYDPSLEALHVDGVAGADQFALDDVATTTTVEGGRAAVGGEGSKYQVGQLFGWTADRVEDPEGPGKGLAAYRVPTAPDHPVEPWVAGQFRYRESIRGWLSYGISHPTTVKGGDGYDVFTLRSFIANGTIKAAGDDGDDTFKYDFEYVANDDVVIDGGEGANTFVAIGTELQDGFAVTDQGVSVCLPGAAGATGLDARVKAAPGITALPLPRPADAGDAATGSCSIGSTVTNVQRYVLYGLQGNDVFWIKSTPAGTETFAISGPDGSTYLLGDEGDLSGLAGRVEVVGDLNNLSPDAEQAMQSVDLSFPLPVLLDGEKAYSAVDALLPGDAVDKTAKHTAVVDGSATTTGQTGVVRPDPATPTAGIGVTGLTSGGLALGGLDNVRIVLGSGGDDLDVRGTLSPYADLAGDGPLPPSTRLGRTELFTGGGADDVQLDAVNGRTWVALEDGKDALRAGTGSAAGLRHRIEVLGGPGVDDVEVDAGGTGQPGLRADVALAPTQEAWSGRTAVSNLGRLSLLDMPADGEVLHDASVDVFRVETGDVRDVVNVRGTVAGSTQLRTAGGDDEVFVSDAAAQALTATVPGLLAGTVKDVGGVDVDAGAGQNLLMVSDRTTTAPRTVALTTDRVVQPRSTSASPTVTMRRGGIAVDATRVTFDATGGSFAQGVTTWLGSGNDAVTVSGTRNDGADPGVLAWDVPGTTGGVRTITTLNTGDGVDTVTATLPVQSGPFVVNLEGGDDTLSGSGSAGRITAFGGAGADELRTGSGDDLVFGDWGRVEYGQAGVLGVPTAMNRVPRVALRPVLVASCTAQPTVSEAGLVSGCELAGDARASVIDLRDFGLGASVHGWLSLGAGDDVAIGGGGSDWIEDASGRNALVGDHGAVQRVAPAALGGPRRISGGGAGFVDVAVLEEAFAYTVDVRDDLGGAPDIVLGGTARDWVFAGAGADLVDLKSGIGAGKKADYRDGWPIGTWWAGKPLLAPADWASRPLATPPWRGIVSTEDTDRVASTVNGSDVVFGGDGPDAVAADVGGAGPVLGDRLVDWHGAYNVYFVCQGAYGAGYVQRASSPALRSAFEAMSVADGAFGANGVRQLAVPLSGNTSPTHPASPGNNHGC